MTGADNELLSDGTYNYSYDANGNLVKQVTIADNSETDYAYDYRNRLVKVTDKDSSGLTTQVVDYSYDAFNRLVTRTLTPYTDGEAGTPVSGHFVYDGNNMVLTLDNSGNVTDRVLYGPAVDQVFAEEDSSGDVTWALGDNQNTSATWPVQRRHGRNGHRESPRLFRLRPAFERDGPTTGQAATVSLPSATPAVISTPPPACNGTSTAGTTRASSAGWARTRWVSCGGREPLRLLRQRAGHLR